MSEIDALSPTLTCKGIAFECTSVCILLYDTKGRQVTGLGLVDIQSSVNGSRHVSAGHTV